MMTPALPCTMGGELKPCCINGLVLLFPQASSSGGKMQLLETEFSRTIRELIELHLLRQDSIPAFLSALTLDLFSRQTIA